MHKTGGFIVGVLLACVIAGLCPGATEAGAEDTAERRMAFGVLWQQPSSLGLLQKYGGGAIQFWPSDLRAVQMGLAMQTEGESNFSFHAEYQTHYKRRGTDSYSFFTGLGLFFYDLPSTPDFDDPFDWNDGNDILIGLYAPLGFQFKMKDSPVSFFASTSVRLFVEPDTFGEILEEVRLGVFCDF